MTLTELIFPNSIRGILPELQTQKNKFVMGDIVKDIFLPFGHKKYTDLNLNS